MRWHEGHIDAIIAHGEDSEYDGENSSAGGRPRELTKQEEDKLQKLIVDEVGLARVTIPYCKKRLKFLRRLSKEGVRLALHHLGLAWRLRRSKSATSAQSAAQSAPSLRLVCGTVRGLSAAESAAAISLCF